MAVAKKCDVCGKLYELYNMKKSAKNWNAIQFYNRDENNKYFCHGILDICPECQKAISDLMKARKGETV